MNFNLLNSIILAGIIQGFVFGMMYLFSEKYRNKSSRYLALLIITFSYNNLQFYLSDVGLLSGAEMYQTIYIPVGSLMPVFIYFYVLSFTGTFEKKVSHKLVFFVPFFIFLTNTVLYKLWPLFTPMTEEVFQNFIVANNIQSISSLVYTLLLLALSYTYVIRFEKKQERNSNNTMYNLGWLKKTLLILFGLSLFWSFALFKYLTNVDYMIYFNLLWIGLSFAIYWLGHLGIYKYGVLNERKNIREYTRSRQPFSITEKTKNDHISVMEDTIVNQKMYLNSSLTLDKIAVRLNLSKSYLSRLINTELGMSFSDYINKLRIEEAIQYLENPEFSNYTLAAIGLEAGFNSKTTFYNSFKKFTGKTPSQFRKSGG